MTYKEIALVNLARTIAKMEGFYRKNSRAARNNNPGNIWDGIGKGKIKRIWPDVPIDDAGYLKYKTLKDGWEALYRQILLDAKRGLTLEQFIRKFAPATENDTENYIKFLETKLEVERGERLLDILNKGEESADNKV